MNRIKQLRQTKRMTQIRLSIELGVSQETVSAYEKGKYYPSFQSLVKMREIFGASIDYIMGLDGAKSSNNMSDDLFIETLRLLNPEDKEKVLAYIQGLTDGKK